MRNAPNIKLATGPALSTEISDIFMNQIDPAHCPTADGGKCTGHPALRYCVVRLALAHATDKQQLIDVLLLGSGTPGLTLLPDTLRPWYNDSLTDYAFDLGKANQILDEAGYKDSDGDGVREMPDGTQPLRFRLLWADDTPDAPRTAELSAKVGARSALPSNRKPLARMPSSPYVARPMTMTSSSGAGQPIPIPTFCSKS